ncbi:hypothetical protein PCASD_15363 [Puccinia coronata f. sp. avenae]|uniref:Uncharacterized protein n=1 Tax=Puccinia coronata f. sp. avenae TaxID=200324 RepID=A0A2N5S211_9BASI|nr:hypothetical protein PCASD_23327 [Puccinia coronata f. sp. avenae]PLW37228.1 hypothetical protein PCASD_15363 [Puccinia coronata f. sp. avenae]
MTFEGETSEHSMASPYPSGTSISCSNRLAENVLEYSANDTSTKINQPGEFRSLGFP